MERYRSAGVATIAALMATGRVSEEEPRALARISRRCERAVVTAYRELRRDGTDDLPALRACTTLYRIHHPEASLQDARRLVAGWIDHHIMRGDAGATAGCDCG